MYYFLTISISGHAYYKDEVWESKWKKEITIRKRKQYMAHTYGRRDLGLCIAAAELHNPNEICSGQGCLQSIACYLLPVPNKETWEPHLMWESQTDKFKWV